MSDLDPYNLRAKYTQFRILVIGRANAGKTTLLQRVCNTTEDPCIYDDDKNLVSVQTWSWWILLLIFQLAWSYFSRTSLTIVSHLLVCWPYISARDTRYQSTLRIQEQSRIYLPRFSWIWDGRREATAGSPVVYEEKSKVEGSKRSTACYLVGFTISAYIPLMVSSAMKVLFCSEQCSAATPTGNEVFWDSEGRKRFSLTPSFKFQFSISHFTVPVIAIFTKFDDLMTQIYDIYQDDDVNRQNAKDQVEKKFRKPLYGYAFPPRADVCFEGKF